MNRGVLQGERQQGSAIDCEIKMDVQKRAFRHLCKLTYHSISVFEDGQTFVTISKSWVLRMMFFPMQCERTISSQSIF